MINPDTTMRIVRINGLKMKLAILLGAPPRIW